MEYCCASYLYLIQVVSASSRAFPGAECLIVLELKMLHGMSESHAHVSPFMLVLYRNGTVDCDEA